MDYGQTRQGYLVSLKQSELSQQSCGLSGLLLAEFPTLPHSPTVGLNIMINIIYLYKYKVYSLLILT